MYGYIYKITNLINNKIYIGKAKNITARFKRHIRDSYNSNSSSYENPIHRAIRKYGPDNFIVEEIDSAVDEYSLNELEKYYIQIYDTRNNIKGYNIAPGGNGGDLLSSKSPEDYIKACENYSKAAKKREANLELRQRKSETLKNLRASTNPIWNKGISPSKESIEKFKLTMQAKYAAGWRPKPYDHWESNGKRVICIETGQEFLCAKDACTQLNLDITKERYIRLCCNKKLKTAFGYHWEFKN